MRRAEGWDVRLTLWADARRGNPFAWGETDCAILAFEAIDAMAGVSELAARFRGRWSSEEEAQRFQTVEDIDAARVLLEAGCEDVAEGLHQRGDIIVVPRDAFQCAHVCMGRLSIAARPGMPVRLAFTRDIVGEGRRTLRLLA